MSQPKSPDGEQSVLLQAAGSATPAWSDEQDESLYATFRVLRKRIWLIAGSTIACFTLAVLACIFWPPKYRSTTLIELSKEDSNIGSGSLSNIASALSGSDDLKTELQTASTVMQSPSVSMGVIAKLHLASNSAFMPHSLFGRAAKPALAESSLPLEENPALREKLVARLAKGLKIEPISDTRLLSVSYTCSDPALAAQVANAVVDEYKRQYLRSHYDSSQDASLWLTEQLSGLKSKVQDAEKKLADFQRQTGIISVDQISMGGMGKESAGKSSFSNPVLDKFSLLNNQLTMAELNRVTKEAIYKLAATQDAGVVTNLGSSPLVMGSDSAVIMQGGGLSALATLQQQQNSLKVDLADAVTKYGAKNPRRTELANRISALDAQIKDELKNILERARGDYEVARKVEDGVRRQFEQQQQLANHANDQAMQLTMLRQEAMAQEMLYEDLYTKLQEANISAGVRASNVSTADVARPPFAPVIPNAPLWLALGLGGGLILGLSTAFFWENLDRTVIASTQVEAITHGPVMGVLPDVAAPGVSAYRFGWRKRRGEARPAEAGNLVPWIVSSPNSNISEAIRSLRTSIMLLRAETPPKVISVTSALPGEGKTTVSVNLAAAFAQQGSRVLLIEADMRRPKLSRLSPDPKANDIGLSDVLTGSKGLREVIFECPDQSNLFVMPGGPRPPIPAELLGSASFSELLSEARREFDFVIIDTPPAVVVTDAVILLPRADCVLCVVYSGVTTRPLLSRVSRLLRCQGGPAVGYVLNRIRTASADYSYYYGYDGRSHYYSEGKPND